MKHMSIKQFEVLTEAADLLSEDGENAEYDRAIVELATRLLGLSHDQHHEFVAQTLRGLAKIERTPAF